MPSQRPVSPPDSRKPWPIRWVVISIVGFIAIYTYIGIAFRKETAPHLPYEQAQIRGGHELRDAGWIPFPNAYWLPGDTQEVARADLPLEPVPFEKISRDDPRFAAWTPLLPPLEQGEQLARVESPVSVPDDSPYLARLFWDPPESFVSPQLIAFRRDRSILIVPRPPERANPGPAEQTVFVIPPDLLEPGEYEVLLSTEGSVNRWTFLAE